ncbi:MAG: hypothetical protein AB7K24_09205 [Gemmataceae bacterium]
MNCNLIQRNLLDCEDPRCPDAEVQEHLGSCQPCHDWHQRLMQIEHNAPRVPIPPSTRKADFLAHLTEDAAATTVCDLNFVDTPVVTSRPRKPQRPAPWYEKFPKTTEFLLKHRYYVNAAIAAAAVIIVFVGWSLFMGPRPERKTQSSGNELAKVNFHHDPLVARLVQSNIRLAQADSLGKRADALRRVATDLHKEAEGLARAEGGEELHRNLTYMSEHVNERLSRYGDSIHFPRNGNSPVSQPERVAELKRNQPLITSLVNRALELASEIDPLRRAESCTAMATLFSGELNQPNCDKDRTQEMVHYLQDVLRQGVAQNLTTVREGGLDADKEGEMRRIVRQVAVLTQPLEQRLSTQSDADLRKLEEVLRSSRTEVENVLRI